jgi:ATP-dependent Clp protease ATP-binding subunit ClpC
MPKINVYLPDDLAEAVRVSGIPISAVCQRALEEAVRRVAAIRALNIDGLNAEELATRLPHFTARSHRILLLAAEHARDEDLATVHTGHLLNAILDEGASVAMQVLNAMGVDLDQLHTDLTTTNAEADGGDDGLHLSGPLANALEFAVTEATAFRHNYIGTEHILLGLTTEPDGQAGQALRAQGVELKPARRAVVAALAILVQGRSQSAAAPGGVQPGAVADAVREAIGPLVERIEQIERRLNA